MAQWKIANVQREVAGFRSVRTLYVTLSAIDDLTDIYEKYRQRTFNEDIEHMVSMGGKGNHKLNIHRGRRLSQIVEE